MEKKTALIRTPTHMHPHTHVHTAPRRAGRIGLNLRWPPSVSLSTLEESFGDE